MFFFHTLGCCLFFSKHDVMTFFFTGCNDCNMFIAYIVDLILDCSRSRVETCEVFSQLRGCDVSNVICLIHFEISGVSAIGLFGGI